MPVFFAIVGGLFLLGVGFFVVALPFNLYHSCKRGEIDVNDKPIRRRSSPILFWLIWIGAVAFWAVGMRQLWIMLSHL